jgi:dihydrofolate reductase/thymidylate synthase
VIGGGDIYKEAIKMKECKKIYVSWVKKRDGGKISVDTFFPRFDFNEYEVYNLGVVLDGDYEVDFKVYEKFVNMEEMQYLYMVDEVLKRGELRMDRTGVGCYSVFGKSMRFDLSKGKIPLFTTKRVFWRGVVEELLWFISGSTDVGVLQRKGIKIWDGNGSREYLDSVGLKDNEVGDLGPVYGFQWRHFGAKYINCKSDYKGQGVDQLSRVIELINRDPKDRRMLVNAWNPSDLGKMALPPCHVMCQFYVSNNGELSCQMYQRSCDMGLGVPFNVASYALLTRMIAYVCGLKCGELVYVMGDVHIYKNHVDGLKLQMDRMPKEFPELEIREEVEKSIDKFEYSSFVLKNYNPCETIGMDMAV